jgi:UDP-N-acetylmuramoylalanine--D-glutamate ligase
MKNYKQQFKGKKITIMGLGLLGRGLGYTKFLAECGAELIVTDLKNKEQLASSLKQLAKFKNIKYTLGEHRLEDFKNRDMIIKAGGVPFDSIYIKEAKKNKIPIEMDVSLFIKSSPKIKVVGVTGTRGKSMTTALIYHILKDNIFAQNVLLGGNMRGVSTLPFLKKVKEGDILVCELDSWQLQGFACQPSRTGSRLGEAGFSPNISVFTSFMPDHMNYYKNSMEKYFEDKANIFKYQKENDVLVVSKEVKKIIKEKLNSKLLLVDKKEVTGLEFIVPGEHQRQNLAYAVAVAKEFGIPDVKIKKSVKEFEGVEGRLQLLRVYKGIKIYNDNNATTPEAVIAGLKALSDLWKSDFQKSGITSRNVILICGGSDKKLDLTDLVKNINKYCKFVSLIPGTGTDNLITNYELRIKNEVGKDLKDVIQNAVKNSKKGDTILFSPAFASFGMFNNEYERNDKFVGIINKLK